MTRISENQNVSSMLSGIVKNRQQVALASQQISSGIVVANAGDSTDASLIVQSQEVLQRIDGYKGRINTLKSQLEFIDNGLNTANDIMARAKELASQAANETVDEQTRAKMAAEVFQIRDQLVSIANAKYGGRYINGGYNDSTAPFSVSTYATPATGASSERYVPSTATGYNQTQQVQITDEISVQSNGTNQTYTEAIYSVEALGRALSGYTTTPTTGAPTGGVAYTFPTDYGQQTLDIRAIMDRIDTATKTDISNERVAVGGRLRRLDSATSVLDIASQSNKEAVSQLQDVDVAEAASRLSLAQTALEGSYKVTTSLLRISILDFV